MKTIFYTASSLDGFLADADNSLDWLFQFGEPEGDVISDFISETGAIAMGSTTYEWLLEHEIKSQSDNPKAWPYKQPTWVFSSRNLPSVNGADIRFIKGDVQPVHQQMAAEAGDKNIWIVGGGDLAGQFYDHGLLDEIAVTIAPVTLGGGAPLFPRKISPLKLISTKAYGDVFVDLRYEVTRGGRGK